MKKKYYQHKETIHSFSWKTLQVFGKQGVIFLIFFMSANFLAPEKFGLFSYLMAIVALFIIFCDFGISSATSKYVAEYKAKKSKDLNKILFSVSIAIIGLATIISLFIIFFGRFIFKEYSLLLYFIPYLFLFPLTSTLDGVYRGLKDFKKLSIITLVVGFISLIASYFLIKSYFLIGAIISQNLLFLLLTIFLFIFRRETKFQLDKKILKKIGRYALIIGITSIAYYLYSRADILILKYFDYLIEISYYEILNKIFLIVLIPFTILGQVIAPNITRLYSKNNYKILKEKLIKHILFSLIIGTVISLVLFLGLPMIIKLFLRDYFTNEILTMLNLLLLILPLRLLATIIAQGHTLATGNAHFSMWTMIPAGIFNILLDFYFISLFGFIGVIYSTLICYTFAIVSFSTLYYLKLNRLIRRKVS